jgi:dTDP-4-amino-4,6-dideoxygalactose transaminase
LRALPGTMICLSFHWSKTLGIQQGGAILLDDPQADAWLRRARFDGREEGVHPKDQKNWQLGYHAYMAPETAAAGLVRLANLPKNNDPLPNSDYPDLSQMDIFR